MALNSKCQVGNLDHLHERTGLDTDAIHQFGCEQQAQSDIVGQQSPAEDRIGHHARSGEHSEVGDKLQRAAHGHSRVTARPIRGLDRQSGLVISILHTVPGGIISCIFISN